MAAPLGVGVNGQPLKVRSRAAPAKVFEARGLVERDGKWYCAVAECSRGVMGFNDASSAKSHPWAAHKIRSPFDQSAKRRDRRLRNAPIASTITVERVEAFVASFDLSGMQAHRLRRDILERIAIPTDAPLPPPPRPIAAVPDLDTPAQVRKGALWPGEEEELRRAILYQLHLFSKRKRRDVTAVVDTLSTLVDRRFHPRGVGLTSVDAADGYGNSPSADMQLDRLADLFKPGASLRPK